MECIFSLEYVSKEMSFFFYKKDIFFDINLPCKNVFFEIYVKFLQQDCENFS